MATYTGRAWIGVDAEEEHHGNSILVRRQAVPPGRKCPGKAWETSLRLCKVGKVAIESREKVPGRRILGTLFSKVSTRSEFYLGCFAR